MIENARFLFVIDNGEPTFYDLSKKGKTMDMNETEDMLNELNNENNELKQFQEKVFDWIDKEISQNEEAIEWGEKQGADVGAMGFYTNMLKMFQKDFADGQYNK